jgi:hypothetical protein
MNKVDSGIGVFLMMDDKAFYIICLASAFALGVLLEFGWFWGTLFLW